MAWINLFESTVFVLQLIVIQPIPSSYGFSIGLRAILLQITYKSINQIFISIAHNIRKNDSEALYKALCLLIIIIITWLVTRHMSIAAKVKRRMAGADEKIYIQTVYS